MAHRAVCVGEQVSELQRMSDSVTSSTLRAQKISSVEFARIFCFFFVIIGHTTPFRGLNGSEYEYLSYVIDHSVNFVIPCFFAIAGYFFHLSLSKTNSLRVSFSKTFKRILTIYLFWSFVYLLPYNVSEFFKHGAWGPFSAAQRAFLHWISSPEIFFLVGPRLHLWFLPAMLCALIITSLFLRLRNDKALYVFAALLYLFGLCAGSYSGTPLGINISFQTRNGPFYGTVFFVAGFWLAGRKNRENWFRMGLMLGIGGYFLELTEAYLLYKLFKVPFWIFLPYYFGSFLFGIGAALVALSGDRLFDQMQFTKYGVYVLGLYAVHFIYIDILAPLDYKVNSIIWQIVYPIIVFSLSILTVSLLNRYAVMKKFIT